MIGNEIVSKSQFKLSNDNCQLSEADFFVKPNYYKLSAVGSVSALEAEVAKGPVAVAIAANGKTFRNYNGGIMNACEGSPNHAALLVGYGSTDSGKDFWLV